MRNILTIAPRRYKVWTRDSNGWRVLTRMNCEEAAKLYADAVQQVYSNFKITYVADDGVETEILRNAAA